MHIVIVSAKSENNVIGREGGLPWSLPADEAFLRREKRFLPEGPMWWS